MDVVGFGESSIDFVHVVPRLPREGTSKLPILSSYSTPGGQVATMLTACAALGLKAGYLGPVGDDEHGQRLIDELRQRGVDTSWTIVRRAPSRIAVILVEEGSGDRIVMARRDAALDVPPDDLGVELIAGARIVHVDAVDEPAAIRLAQLGRSAGATVTCDVDTVTPRTAELLRSVSAPVVAAPVPSQLTGIADRLQALRALAAEADRTICVTFGADGSAAASATEFVHIPAPAIEAVDTTGAGDIFRAAYAYALIQGWPLERRLRFANAAAALSCTRRGAMPSVPSLQDVLRSL